MKTLTKAIGGFLMLTVAAFGKTTSECSSVEAADPIIIEVLTEYISEGDALGAAKTALMQEKFIPTGGMQERSFTAQRTTGSRADYYVADVAADVVGGRVKLTITFIKIGTGFLNLQKVADSVRMSLGGAMSQETGGQKSTTDHSRAPERKPTSAEGRSAGERKGYESAGPHSIGMNIGLGPVLSKSSFANFSNSVALVFNADYRFMTANDHVGVGGKMGLIAFRTGFGYRARFLGSAAFDYYILTSRWRPYVGTDIGAMVSKDIALFTLSPGAGIRMGLLSMLDLDIGLRVPTAIHFPSGTALATLTMSAGVHFRFGGGRKQSTPAATGYMEPEPQRPASERPNRVEAPPVELPVAEEEEYSRPAELDRPSTQPQELKVVSAPRPAETTPSVSSDFSELIRLNKHLDIIADHGASVADRTVSKAEVLASFINGDVPVVILRNGVAVDYYSINEFLRYIEMHHFRYKVTDRKVNSSGLISEIRMHRID